MKRCVLCVVLALAACGRQDGAKAKDSPPTIESALLLEVTRSGNEIYMWNHHGVWYVREGHAARVRGLPDHLLIDSVIPVGDSGGAYALFLGQGVWFLSSGSAMRVREIKTLGGGGLVHQSSSAGSALKGKPEVVGL